MTVRDDVLRFLREPAQFIDEAVDADLWLAGLDEFATPSIAARQDRILRPAQEAAWRGLATKRAGLVLGPPGTGKTHILSWFVAGFCAAHRQAGRPARVLITAFTRNAIGNVLEAVATRQGLHDAGALPPVYLGEPPASGLSAGVIQLDRSDADTLVAQLAAGQCVAGMTVWSLWRLIETKTLPGADGPTAPLFDLICIDEASQMVLGHGLMALAGLAKNGRVVVAGDDQQLPPVRAGRPVLLEGRELGGSLYAFMKSVGVPEFALEETYRLNEPLTIFPERTFYPGRYVSRSTSKLALRPGWEQGLDLLSRTALNPDLPLVVLLHDGPTAATMNPFEVQVASRLAEEIASRIATDATGTPADLWTKRLAIVSPHRAQNAAIRSSLAPSIRDGAFVETVDRIQGKEREAVILSYCVADAEFALAEGEFIFSPERLNVATTRAEGKLVAIVSRRLLEAVPAEQELLDKSELLREFVFSCPEVARTTLLDLTGRQIRVEIRARGFADREGDIDLTPDPAPVASHLRMTQREQGVLDAIRRVANESQWGNAALSRVRSAMALPVEPLPEAGFLHRVGWISLKQRNGPRGPFLVAFPFASPRTVYAPDFDTVRIRIDMAIREARGGRHAYYNNVRDRFGWMDDTGYDILMPVMRQLEDEGVLVFGSAGDSVTIAMRHPEVQEEPDDLPPPPALADHDFHVLNRLEDMEAKRINFGVFDTWTSSAELAATVRMPSDAAAASLARLQEQGHVLLADDGRVRSRMAELARELKHVKQRFWSNDAGQRPYLVRSLKVELRDRAKPERTLSITDALGPGVKVATPSQRRALDGINRVLLSLWGDKAALAGFQAEGIKAVLAGWNGSEPSTIAIAADTGSGKTEAAALPLIAGALADRIDGIEGTRAILAYPRIRLATNQAQRLVGYLAACENNDLPLLTLGIQVGDVPQSFTTLTGRWLEAWRPAGPDAFAFPFFACPTCAHDLVLRPGEGQAGADSLQCRDCGWRYNGWVGSKQGLRERPPSLFLLTTDSLHQWLHNPSYGRIFGDDPGFAAPRAVLADEIHLYTHVHGAQVGLALRRLAARTKTSDQQGRAMLAIGMSATISDPARAWGRLIGRDQVTVIRPGPNDRTPNPKGREYFYFLQPEVESRGADIAGASTTIQALMCLGHGVRRRTGREGGFRSLVFFDSIDKMRRLHTAYVDAEGGRELAAYRTSAYGDDATGAPQTRCCREPVGCDRFADGECWWFAATDPRQCGAGGRRSPGQPLRVVPTPIYSGTGGNAEKLVKDADVVFATSSLEVGYDDPDITVVYQHYAPMNLASFVQRKGRGGRGADDRPTTAVTLSIYSPRDSWWFRRPHEMVSPTNFEVPLNPDNAYVRRGQALSALLDGLARHQRQSGRNFVPVTAASPAALATAHGFVEAVFGPGIWVELDVADATALWSRATAGVDLLGCKGIPDVRERLEWAPNLLFESINLPSLTVTGPDVFKGEQEDISLALATLAPGNATRRYSGHSVHWTAPAHGRAPWLTKGDYDQAERQQLRESTDALLLELPSAVRESLAGLHFDLCRPRSVTVQRLGHMTGAHWTGDVGFRADRDPKLAPFGYGDVSVRHDSRGELSGFLLVKADQASANDLSTERLTPTVSRVEVFRSSVTRNKDSGLRIARVYWGADAELRFDDRAVQPETYSQVFTDPQTGNPLLHGYEVTTEGLRLHVDSTRLDATVAYATARMQGDEAERKWRAAQFTRFLIESRARATGINAYEAKRGADLLVAAAGDAELRIELVRLKRFWGPERVAALLERTRAKMLSQHPLMTPARVARTATAIATDVFRDLLARSLEEVTDEASMRGYIRSCILHGLALRARTWTAFVGSGDEGRMFAHVRLPIQFGQDAQDVITIAEAGSHGDGTMRAVAERWEQATTLWGEGFLSQCPNADEDAAMRRFWTMRGRHEAWRKADARDARVLARIAEEITPQAIGRPLPAAITRILFGVESVGADTFALYDIAADLEASHSRLSSGMGRHSSDWELVTAAVADAAKGEAPELHRLHAAYGSVGETAEESFSSDTRLADQVFRLGAPLCHDGCRACVQQASDLMGGSLVQSSTSRSLLQDFLR